MIHDEINEFVGGNPWPEGTEGENANVPAVTADGVPLDEFFADLLKDVKPAPFVRPSKHRAGRALRKLTPKERKRRDALIRRGEQASKSLYLEHRKDFEALERALAAEA